MMAKPVPPKSYTKRPTQSKEHIPPLVGRQSVVLARDLDGRGGRPHLEFYAGLCHRVGFQAIRFRGGFFSILLHPGFPLSGGGVAPGEGRARYRSRNCEPVVGVLGEEADGKSCRWCRCAVDIVASRWSRLGRVIGIAPL